MKYQKKIALCAILSALNVLVLLFGALLDVLDLIFPYAQCYPLIGQSCCLPY